MNKQQRDIIQDFEEMRDLAELKALSNFSLENPLSNEQHKRMMELGKKVGLVN